jgi:transposase, IS30 family
MKNIKDLSRAERLEIKILLNKGYSMRSIGEALDRGKSTISYEIKQNQTNSEYDPLKAHAKARFRKRMRKLEWSKLSASPQLQAFVIAKLKLHWNPDEIAGYLKKHPQLGLGYVSKTAIYEWLRTARGERYCRYLYSKRKRVKKRRAKVKKELIPNRVSINKRFLGASNRTRYGHFEDDSVVGRKGTRGGLKVVAERKSRLILAHKVESMRPREHLQVEREMFHGVKALSISRDNGIENRCHESLGIPSFFCDPYASWQKGGVEQANKMLRRYFPKGTNFEMVSQNEVDQALSLINNKPRKILGYRSALEVARAAGIIKNIKSESVLTLG